MLVLSGDQTLFGRAGDFASFRGYGT